ncbi:PqqD family protein [Prevotella sp. HJM029]|uniref:PqqD family protein n=1 Tax=Prevotella sp. HJM029 TaxID=1433844 RepID=UPI00048E5402|nr:PqqD family protein [Prevotella sp. HJM029]
MRTKKDFNLRNVCGENIIVAEGEENIDFSDIISMNETSAYLWKQVQGKEFTPELLVELLMQEYDVAEGEALRDVEQLIKVWCDAGIAE